MDYPSGDEDERENVSISKISRGRITIDSDIRNELDVEEEDKYVVLIPKDSENKVFLGRFVSTKEMANLMNYNGDDR